MKKRTAVYPEHIKPARRGVYAVTLYSSWSGLPLVPLADGYSFWDGCRWSYMKKTPREAYANRHIEGSQRKTWQGLTEAA